LLDKFLTHPLSHVHIVLVTRRDPPLALTKLRAGSRVAEVRLRDLQFTGPETAELVAANLGCNISNDSLANVQSEIKGWAAGLRLVLLAVHHADDPDAALKALHGGVAHLQEYLIIEVLDGLPERVGEYLLKSAVLDRFCADVIEAICCAETPSARPQLSGREYIHRLQRDNLFILPLDTEGVWFRHHHLFKALLQDQLLRQFASGDIKQLHERASAWF
jgi:LuxR family maltose regulon positive regulatory protein